MKKIYLPILVVFAFILSAPLARASFDQSLSYGMAGQNVLELQDFLYDQGCFPVQPTGYFGAITLASVKCFQAKYGIIQTGYFGILSRTEANGLLSEMLAPSNEAATQEMPTSTPAIIPVQSIPTPPVTNLPTQSPQISQPMQPQITITGSIPTFVLSNLPDGVVLNGFDFVYTSDTFTPDQLAPIQAVAVYSRGEGGGRTWNQYDITFKNVPSGSGSIKVVLSDLNLTGATADVSAIKPAYITDIHANPGVPGQNGYSISGSIQ